MRRSAGGLQRSLAALAFAGLALGACTATTSSYNAAAPWTGPRSIAMHQPDTGQRLNVVYGSDGVYDQRAMEQVADLFKDRRTGEAHPVDPKLLDLLVTVRERLGLTPATTFVVTSGYRSPLTNAALARRSPNVAENSYHLRGQAVDFHIDGVSSERIAAVAGDLALGGYAWYPHTGHVHLDTGPVRTWTPRAPRRGGGWIEVKTTSQRSAVAVAAAPRPGAGKPASAAKNSAAKAASIKPAAFKPANAKAVAAKPVAAKPAAAKPSATKPAAAKSSSAKPAAKPVSAKR